MCQEHTLQHEDQGTAILLSYRQRPGVRLVLIDATTARSGIEPTRPHRAVLTRAFALMSMGWFDTEDTFAAGDRCVVLWTYTFNREERERGHLRGVDVFRGQRELAASTWANPRSLIVAQSRTGSLQQH